MPRTTRRKIDKFPLTLHRKTGQYAKNFTLPSGRRRMVYFGTDADAALKQYLAEREDWQAGRNPREANSVVGTTDPTVADVCNAYLTAQKLRAKSGEIRGRTLHENISVCKRLAHALGRNRMVSTLTAADFERYKAKLSETNSPSSVAQIINKSKAPFKYAFEADLIDKPVKFGPHFRTPGKRALRQQQNRRPSRLFTPQELRRMIDEADAPLKAWILLGLNAGYGAADLATLPRAAVDLENGWIEHERAKTATRRKVALWPETIKALRESFKLHRKPRKPEYGELAFLNRKGNPLVNEAGTGTRQDTAGKLFREHLIALGLHRQGVGHYSLRHVFRTVADNVGDDRAVRLVMGHVEDADDMGSHYVHGISEERLRRISDFVHGWLYADEFEPPTERPALRIVG